MDNYLEIKIKKVPNENKTKVTEQTTEEMALRLASKRHKNDAILTMIKNTHNEHNCLTNPKWNSNRSFFVNSVQLKNNCTKS